MICFHLLLETTCIRQLRMIRNTGNYQKLLAEFPVQIQLDLELLVRELAIVKVSIHSLCDFFQVDPVAVSLEWKVVVGVLHDDIIFAS